MIDSYSNVSQSVEANGTITFAINDVRTCNLITHAGGTGTFTFTSGTSQTISLKHGETIKITGLTAGDTYTVSEDPADGYTTTYKIDTGSETPYTTALTDTIYADRTITFINTKNASTPTGVILTFMPYILMILAGFVVASLFLRRKRR